MFKIIEDTKRLFQYSEPVDRRIREQLLARGAIALIVGLSSVFFNFPLSIWFLVVALIGAAVHVFAYIYFYSLRSVHLSLLSCTAMVVIGFALHYTGGLTSPLLIIFSSIIVSDVSFGIRPVWSLPVGIIVYVSVIFLEYFNIISQPVINAATIYQSLPFTAVFLLLVIVLFVRAYKIQNLVLYSLRNRVLKQSEEAEEYREQLHRMNKSYETGFMASQMLHELCGPLACINGFLNWVTDNHSLGTDLARDLSDMRSEVGRLNNLVVKLKSFIKPGEGEKVSFVLNEIICIVASILKMDTKCRDICIVNEFSDYTVFKAYGCKDEIQEVFFNLLKNSAEAVQNCKYANGKGEIRIKLLQEKDKVLVFVTDNGRGMDAKQIENVSKKYFTTKKDGLGLGLSIVRNILTSHGSMLSIKSEPGVGTEVSFELPVSGPVFDTKLGNIVQ